MCVFVVAVVSVVCDVCAVCCCLSRTLYNGYERRAAERAGQDGLVELGHLDTMGVKITGSQHIDF